MQQAQGQRIRAAAVRTVEMANIYPEAVVFRIDRMPGSPPLEFEVEPGKTLPVDENLCIPVPGAGQDENGGPSHLPPIIERITMRTWSEGVRYPALVPAKEAKERSKHVERLIAKAKADNARALGEAMTKAAKAVAAGAGQ